MKVFLSWSDARSMSMAKALREWLPLVLHYAEPWFSDKDIPAGERWSLEVGKRLEETDFGIICLTKDNLNAPWILFEAGALSKALSVSSVCPYLLDVDFSDITAPLSQFQAKKINKDSTLEMVLAINKKASGRVEESRVRELFEFVWPKLEQQLQNIPASQTSPEQHTRPEPEILEELVEGVRAVDRRLGNLETDITRLGFSVNTMPAARPSRVQPITLTIGMEGTKFKKASQVKIKPSLAGPRFLENVSDILELDAKEFGTNWYLLDSTRFEFLTRDECRDIYGYFGDSKPSLEVTDDEFANMPF